MANDTTKNPWILDGTVGTVTTTRLRVSRVRWVGPTDATHVATLNDAAGRAMLKMNADAAGADVEVVEVAECAGQEWAGLAVPTGGIPSGAVYLTYE